MAAGDFTKVGLIAFLTSQFLFTAGHRLEEVLEGLDSRKDKNGRLVVADVCEGRDEPVRCRFGTTGRLFGAVVPCSSRHGTTPDPDTLLAGRSKRRAQSR